MLKKINVFLSFILAINLSSNNSLANDEYNDDYFNIETIKQEDEHLLDTSFNRKKLLRHEVKIKTVETPKTIDDKTHPIYPTKKDRQKARAEEKEWFKSLSSFKKEAPKPVDPRFKEFKIAINECYENHAQNLNLEKDLLRSGNIYTNASFISQTFEKINSCYEDRGLDIIATFYNNDTTLLQNFSQKAKTFYVNGVDSSFTGRYCNGKCSFEAIIDEQINKFKEFKSYLLELLNQKEGKKS